MLSDHTFYSSILLLFLFFCCCLQDQCCVQGICHAIAVYICTCCCVCIQACKFCTCCQDRYAVACCDCTVAVYVTEETGCCDLQCQALNCCIDLTLYCICIVIYILCICFYCCQSVDRGCYVRICICKDCSCFFQHSFQSCFVAFHFKVCDRIDQFFVCTCDCCFVTVFQGIFCFADRIVQFSDGITCVVAVCQFFCCVCQFFQGSSVCVFCQCGQFSQNCVCCCIDFRLSCFFVCQKHNCPDLPGLLLLLRLLSQGAVSVRRIPENQVHR